MRPPKWDGEKFSALFSEKINCLRDQNRSLGYTRLIITAPLNKPWHWQFCEVFVKLEVFLRNIFRSYVQDDNINFPFFDESHIQFLVETLKLEHQNFNLKSKQKNFHIILLITWISYIHFKIRWILRSLKFWCLFSVSHEKLYLTPLLEKNWKNDCILLHILSNIVCKMHLDFPENLKNSQYHGLFRVRYGETHIST